MCLAQRKAPGRNESSGRVGGPGPCWTSKAASLPPMRCTAIATLPPRCARVACDYVLALKENQSKLFAAAARLLMRAASPQRCRTDRAHQLTIAAKRAAPTVLRDCRLRRRSRSSPASWRWAASPRAAACRARPPSHRWCATSCSRNIFSAKRLLRHRALPLEDREPTALGTRCRLERGPQPNPQRPRSGEPCHPPTARPQSVCSPTPRQRPCAGKSNARGGTTPSSWACSVICDSPAHKGEGEEGSYFAGSTGPSTSPKPMR